MKKELVAALLLGLILTGCILNSRIITNLAGDLTALVEAAGREAENGRWENAGLILDEAFALIGRRSLYIGVFLTADDTDRIVDSLDQLRSQIHSQNAAAISSAVHLAVSRIDSIANRERVSIGSVF